MITKKAVVITFLVNTAIISKRLGHYKLDSSLFSPYKIESIYYSEL